MKKTSSYYIKSFTLMVLLAVESYFLTSAILNFAQSLNYFGIDTNFYINVILLMITIIATLSLTIGGWDKWMKFVIFPLPISLGIFASVFSYDLTNSLILFLLAFALLCYSVQISALAKNQFIKVNANQVLANSFKSVSFVFSLTAGLLVFFTVKGQGASFSLGNIFFNSFGKQIKQTIESNMLAQFGPSFNLTANIDLNMIIPKTIDQFTAPFKEFIPPIMALVVFGLFKLLGMVAEIISSFINPALFLILKKTGFLKVTLTQVTKEDLSFSTTTP